MSQECKKIDRQRRHWVRKRNRSEDVDGRTQHGKTPLWETFNIWTSVRKTR